MNQIDAIKISRRVEDDLDLLKRMIQSSREAGLIMNGETMRALEDSQLHIRASAETIDSELNVYQYLGKKTDTYIPTRTILRSTADIVVKNNIMHDGK